MAGCLQPASCPTGRICPPKIKNLTLVEDFTNEGLDTQFWVVIPGKTMTLVKIEGCMHVACITWGAQARENSS